MSKRSRPQFEESGPAKKHPKGHWMRGLFDVMKNPDNILYESDETVAAIKDGYDKAKFHFLVMPRKVKINNLNEVTKEHLNLLRHMEEVGLALTKREECRESKFKLGYHAEPSMPPLHLHVISDDMDSVCMKTKKHWNSFTTDFFLDSKRVCEELEEKGVINLPSKDKCKRLLETPLRCHKCDLPQKNIPVLKEHIRTHLCE